MKKKRKPRKIKTKNKILFEYCTRKWSEIIKLRAENKSEISGKSKDHGYNLAAHHLMGKANYALRFSVSNGICLEAVQEHLYGIHNSDPDVQDHYREEIKKARGDDVFSNLRILKWQTWTDLNIIKIYLDDEYKKAKKVFDDKQR